MPTSPPARPRFADLPVTPGQPKNSAWGLWGPDDETGTVNISNHGECTIKQFAQVIKARTGNHPGIAAKHMRTQDDPQVRQPDITKARRVLGWEPSVDVEEGLRRTIPWFREELRRRGELPA